MCVGPNLTICLKSWSGFKPGGLAESGDTQVKIDVLVVLYLFVRFSQNFVRTLGGQGGPSPRVRDLPFFVRSPTS